MSVNEQKVGVVGAGNMGSGIAQKYASEGFNVVVVDMNEAAAAAGRDRVAATLNEGVKRKIFSEEKRDAILARMTFTADKSMLQDAALVVEAIFENKEVKQSLFKELDGLCDDDTLLATNTSSFYVDDVAEPTVKKGRVIGLHYFYHPAKNRLVEVIAGTATSDDAFARAWSIQERSGKTPIRSKDAPGFIVNRYFVPWLNEAMRIVEEGAADIATVEAAAKAAFGVGMGPFELMNVTGVPITLHAATTLGAELGAFYAPCDLIRPVVEKKENWPLEGTPDASKFDAVGARLWGVVMQIATRIVCDETVCTAEDCDLGARVGLRWPVGPIEKMNAIGTKKALAYVEAIAARYDDVEVPAELARLGAENKPFDFRVVHAHVENDGVGFLTIDRPDAMNALSELVMAQIEQGFDQLHGDASCKGIVIRGRGKAFVAGADVKFFVDQIEANNVPHIVEYASGGQKIFRKIDVSTKPVVCQLDGLSLGGGTELALACDHIVATPHGTVGFPETGIGIFPGLGGTQRTARRIGVPLARWMVLTGQVLDAKSAQGLGLVDEVVAPEALDAAVRKAALSRPVQAERSPPDAVPAGYEALRTAFTGDLEVLKSGAPAGDDVAAQKALKKLGHKAPVALARADALVCMAATASLQAGLDAEVAQLDEIFRTEDALIGMKSVVQRQRPTFVGR